MHIRLFCCSEDQKQWISVTKYFDGTFQMKGELLNDRFHQKRGFVQFEMLLLGDCVLFKYSLSRLKKIFDEMSSECAK